MTSALYVPSGCTTASRLWLLPAESVTVIETLLPAGASVVPVIVGVVSLVMSGALTVRLGACVSTTALSLEGALTLPAESTILAETSIEEPFEGAGYESV